MPGRKKTPSAMKILKGTNQPCRMNPREPKPLVVELKCPSYLTAQGKRTFKNLAKLLKDMKVAAASDQQALAMLSDMYSIYRQMRDTLKKNGFTYEIETQNGGTMHRARPEVAILNEAWKNTRSMMSEFGLTPSSRTKVSASGPNEENPLDKFIGIRKNG